VVDYLNLLVRAFYGGPVSKVHAVRSMFETLCNVLDRLCPEYLVFALDGGHLERSQRHPAYKADREAKPAELVEQIALGEQALEALGWPSIRVVGWEADDVLASMATQFRDVAIAVILVTSDKDVLQVAGETGANVYQPWKEGLHFNNARCQQKYGVPLSRMRDYLALCGDKTDGVPGVPGIGEKTAAELLQTHGSLDAVLAAAAAGSLTGRAGKALAAHADQARLSLELVRLNAALPVGVNWQDWPIESPRAGWRARLQELGLGSVAQRLAERLVGDPRQTTASSRTEICASYDARPAENPVPISPESRPADANETAARRVYQQAIEARQRHGKAACSGYYEGTLQRAAWEAGSRGEPFESIDLAAYDGHGRPIPLASATEEPVIPRPHLAPAAPVIPAAAKVAQRELF